MRRFIIIVKGLHANQSGIETDLQVQSDWEMSEEEHLLFVQESKLEHSMACEICGSYVVSARTLYRKLEILYDNNALDVFASEVSSLLTESTESMEWDNERWNDYMEGKFRVEGLLYEDDGSEESDCDGNFLCLEYEECAFILDPTCSCFPTMQGDP